MISIMFKRSKEDATERKQQDGGHNVIMRIIKEGIWSGRT
jgi:hypothetical protein